MKKTILFSFVLIMLGLQHTNAQSFSDPKMYQNVPEGLKLIQLNYGYQNTKSSLDFNIPLPETDTKVHVNSVYLRYAQFFSFLGKTSAIQVAVPYAWIDANILGREANNNGFGDMVVVIGSNIFGADAMSQQELMKSPRKAILSWSLSVTMPTGSYSSDKMLNTSSHRWQIRPELGFSTPLDAKFDLDIFGYVDFYSPNHKYYNFLKNDDSHVRLSQKPIYTLTAHLSYNINPYAYVSFTTHAKLGGETNKNSVAQDNSQALLVLGGSVTSYLSPHLQASAGCYVNTLKNNVSNGFNCKASLAYLF